MRATSLILIFVLVYACKENSNLETKIKIKKWEQFSFTVPLRCELDHAPNFQTSPNFACYYCWSSANTKEPDYYLIYRVFPEISAVWRPKSSKFRTYPEIDDTQDYKGSPKSVLRATLPFYARKIDNVGLESEVEILIYALGENEGKLEAITQSIEKTFNTQGWLRSLFTNW